MNKKNFAIILLFCCYILVGCSQDNKDEVVKIDNKSSVESDNAKVDIEKEIAPEETEVREKEVTFKMKSSDLDKTIADYVYIYDTMDNYGETTTIIPGIYNNTNENISNFTLVFNFIKDGNIVKSQEVLIEKEVGSNGGFYGAPVFLAEIPISDFDSIEINIKE